MINSHDRLELITGSQETKRGIIHSDGSEYSDEERVFLTAMADYCQSRKRRFPKFTEVLAVLKSMGYRLVAEPEPIPKICW